MEIEITKLLDQDNVDLMDYSASIAEIGDRAGIETWENSLAATEFHFFQTTEQRHTARDYIKSTGGWTLEEIDLMSNVEINALMLQFIVGDLREYWRAFEEGLVHFIKWNADHGGSIYHYNGKLYYTVSE